MIDPLNMRSKIITHVYMQTNMYINAYIYCLYTYSFNSVNPFQEHPDNLIEPKILGKIQQLNSIKWRKLVASCEWCNYFHVKESI